jgi:choice-of-anchor A domain-containing protein
MRATTTLVLFILVPCLGACDYQLGDLPGPDEEEPGAQCAPDAGSGPPPVLTLVGPATQSHECATAYTDPGATASDVCFGDLTRAITRAGEVDTQAPGSYPLTYNVSNPAGQSATPVSRTVNVQDTQPPVVTPSGPLNVALECGSPYADPGAAASDECAGALPAVPTSLPDPSTPGSYSLRYQATDPSGNVALSTSERMVTVADTLAPTLALVGPVNATHECGATYLDPGATATDQCAGDLTGAVVATQTGDPNLPGTMTINYSVTDPAGHSTVAAQPRVVNVTDTLPPVLALMGSATQAQECARSYTDPGATAMDGCFGDVSSRITRAGTVDTTVLGSYSLTYNVTDPAGQGATPVNRTVNVQDTLPPVAISIQGPTSISLECGSPYTDPGATASDECAGALPAVPSSLPDSNTTGSYSLRYRATDPSGNTVLSSTARTVTVADTLAPTITVNGPLDQPFECGGTYVDPGATATDVCTGPVPVTSTRNGSSTTPGTMTITYSATDPNGNTATSPVIRTVHVNDNTPPVLALVGSASQAQECARPYNELGATAMDACFGDVSSRITRTGTVDTTVLGSYPVTYNVTDPAGQSATPVSRTVNVQDTLPPLVSILGPINVTLECGSPYTDPGATASDECAGDLPVPPTGVPDTSAPGSYILWYSAADPSGNTGTSSTPRTVGVVDTQFPNITVQGPLEDSLECGDTYVDPGATANDVCAGPVAVWSTQTGSSTTPGAFTLFYSAADPSGNIVTSPVTRTVHVNDNTPPVLTLVGPATQVQECAFPYTDPGATAMDACFGDVSSRITRTGTVDTTELGSYPLTYNVTDPAGNSATPVSRTVNVQDTLAPMDITIHGPAIIAMECGGSYTDPGASANDACAGDLPAVPTGAPDPRTVGNYSFGYRVTDPSGNTTTSHDLRAVMVRDTVVPDIVVLGPIEDSTECGGTYVDPGATATDVCAGSVPVTATRNGSSTTPGQFTITYSAADPSGNTVTSPVVRTVHVNDNTRPVLTLLGPETQMHECASPYTDPGATAVDNCSGDLSGRIIRHGTVVTTELGIYTLEYQVTDDAGNWAMPVTRTVNVGDWQPPVVTPHGPLNINVECGSSWADPGATATDACVGPLLVIATGEPDTSTPGIYSFWYQATDLSGNTGTSADARTVTVIDTEPPTLTLNGPLNVTLECGDTYVDPGATATDICAGDLPVVAAGTVDSNAPGTYVIVYSVADPAGNTTTAAQPRVVNIVDTLRPVLELLPGPSVIECNGPPYVDPGARAIDQCSGDRTHEINVTGSVDHTRAGEYTIAYDVTDPSGNTTVGTRTITVEGPCAICFSVALSDDNLLLLEDSGAARFVELRGLSWRLSRLTAHGETTREGRGGLRLKGTDPELNVFEVKAQELTGETQLSIDAPAGSLVVLNVHGDSVVLEGFRPTLSGGIDSQDVLYNFVDATSIHAEGVELEGTVLAPYARIDFNDGSWEGGLYAVSLTGNAQGEFSPLRDRTLCP